MRSGTFRGTCRVGCVGDAQETGCQCYPGRGTARGLGLGAGGLGAWGLGPGAQSPEPSTTTLLSLLSYCGSSISPLASRFCLSLSLHWGWSPRFLFLVCPCHFDLITPVFTKRRGRIAKPVYTHSDHLFLGSGPQGLPFSAEAFTLLSATPHSQKSAYRTPTCVNVCVGV